MRRDLTPLLGLPRCAAGSHLAKVIEPPQRKCAFVFGGKEAPPAPFKYTLKNLSSSQVIAWARAYWKNRIGRKHTFYTWKRSNGVFAIENKYKVALAGDWGSGTDEA